MADREYIALEFDRSHLEPARVLEEPNFSADTYDMLVVAINIVLLSFLLIRHCCI